MKFEKLTKSELNDLFFEINSRYFEFTSRLFDEYIDDPVFKDVQNELQAVMLELKKRRNEPLAGGGDTSGAAG